MISFLRHWFGGKKGPKELRVGHVLYLGEQDGPAAQDLKRELADLFDRQFSVEEAYLVRVRMVVGSGAQDSVALCILGVAEPGRGECVDAVSRTFAGLFHSDQHLDILFPDHADVARLRETATPFYPRRLGIL